MQVFARINPALGHLPGVLCIVPALANKNLTGPVDQHQPDAGAIGQPGQFARRHCPSTGAGISDVPSADNPFRISIA